MYRLQINFHLLTLLALQGLICWGSGDEGRVGFIPTPLLPVGVPDANTVPSSIGKDRWKQSPFHAPKIVGWSEARSRWRSLDLLFSSSLPDLHSWFKTLVLRKTHRDDFTCVSAKHATLSYRSFLSRTFPSLKSQNGLMFTVHISYSHQHK